MRIQVNLSDELTDKLDSLSRSLGISRSAFCAMLIGQGVVSYQRAYDMLDNLDLTKAIEKSALSDGTHRRMKGGKNV